MSTSSRPLFRYFKRRHPSQPPPNGPPGDPLQPPIPSVPDVQRDLRSTPSDGMIRRYHDNSTGSRPAAPAATKPILLLSGGTSQDSRRRPSFWRRVSQLFRRSPTPDTNPVNHAVASYPGQPVPPAPLQFNDPCPSPTLSCPTPTPNPVDQSSSPHPGQPAPIQPSPNDPRPSPSLPSDGDMDVLHTAPSEPTIHDNPASLDAQAGHAGSSSDIPSVVQQSSTSSPPAGGRKQTVVGTTRVVLQTAASALKFSPIPNLYQIPNMLLAWLQVYEVYR
ncbi:uncharacterized protein EI90DRAFT_1765228 [Cantharellus anzutake]|uniref:uncharacterized protein n=1 Tax=Cantharellus anzutake TaxID=1750568 RepID=UPI001902D414|nr:uncharacterized protein EI90DRAFT_1765228 [Cantharellus anzutake]KAF8327546.1 hypothetical protein EI90DRAFT_1765228 [Cantharellus anzutake]